VSQGFEAVQGKLFHLELYLELLTIHLELLDQNSYKLFNAHF
jgi:hypothetical protein